MKTQYFTATSLDGFIATEDDSLEWLFPLGDVNDSSYPTFIADVGALAMGSSTYEWMLRNADKVAAEMGTPWPYTQPAWIFTSRTLPAIEGADIRFVKGDVRPVHAEMCAAAGGKNIWIVGGGDLAGQFHDAGLLDELILQIGSVTLGKGKQLFPRRVLNPALRLVSVRQIGTSMAELHYVVSKDSAFSTSRLFPFTPAQVFSAFANPDLLASWWGPDGFSNTFEVFEFKPQGRWKFFMHGPDGTRYPNDSVFLEASPQRIVVRHVSPPNFTLTITLTEEDGKTKLDWHQAFDDPRVAAGMAHIVVPANEQNLDRLHAALGVAVK